MTEDQIKHMVNRFLAWKLPESFNPDGGVSFKATFNEGTPYEMKHEPVGTNLLSASQADAMVRYTLDGVPPARMTDEKVRDVQKLLDVYAPDTFDLEMAAAVTSRAING